MKFLNADFPAGTRLDVSYHPAKIMWGGSAFGPGVEQAATYSDVLIPPGDYFSPMVNTRVLSDAGWFQEWRGGKWFSPTKPIPLFSAVQTSQSFELQDGMLDLLRRDLTGAEWGYVTLTHRCKCGAMHRRNSEALIWHGHDYCGWDCLSSDWRAYQKRVEADKAWEQEQATVTEGRLFA